MKKITGLNGTQLKLLAAFLMVVDHMGLVLFPQYIIFRIIGRLSFPIFCFTLAEGFYYTHSMKKHMLLLLVAAVISEPLYDVVLGGSITYRGMNVMFTFLLAAVAVRALQFVEMKKDSIILKILSVIVMFLCAVIAEYASTDYGAYGVIMILIFYILRPWKVYDMLFSSLYMLMTAGIQRYSVLSVIPIALYNGKAGKKYKYFFYIFYPAHLIVLYIISRFVY